MLGRVSRHFFHALAGSRQLQRLASRVGMRKPTSFARRFIAGETIDDAIEAARAVQANGFLLTLDYLGENVTNLDEAQHLGPSCHTGFDRDDEPPAATLPTREGHVPVSNSRGEQFGRFVTGAASAGTVGGGCR